MTKLFESVGEPRLYHTAIKYWHSAASSGRGGKTTKSGPRRTTEQLIHQTPGPFEREFAAFTKFFHQRTGVPWDDRIVAFAKGKAKDGVGKYVYEPPVRVSFPPCSHIFLFSFFFFLFFPLQQRRNPPKMIRRANIKHYNTDGWKARWSRQGS